MQNRYLTTRYYKKLDRNENNYTTIPYVYQKPEKKV